MTNITLRPVEHAAVLAWVLLLPSPSAASETPTPSPTPQPRTLAAYARDVKLDLSALDARDGPPVLGIDEVTALAAGRTLIVGGTTAPQATPRPTPSPQDRTRWRKRVDAQRKRIAVLESRRVRVAAEIDRLESGRLTAAVLARIDRQEIELEALDADIRRERGALARLIREAREHGAEPGWFR